MKRITFEPDVLWNYNNSTMFVVPTSTGKLAEYAVTNEFGLVGWLFSDIPSEIPGVREGLPGYVISGSTRDGEDFLSRCEAAGMVVAQVNNLGVPFSSGRRRNGPNAGNFRLSEFYRTFNVFCLEKIERDVLSLSRG